MWQTARWDKKVLIAIIIFLTLYIIFYKHEISTSSLHTNEVIEVTTKLHLQPPSTPFPEAATEKFGTNEQPLEIINDKLNINEEDEDEVEVGVEVEERLSISELRSAYQRAVEIAGGEQQLRSYIKPNQYKWMAKQSTALRYLHSIIERAAAALPLPLLSSSSSANSPLSPHHHHHHHHHGNDDNNGGEKEEWMNLLYELRKVESEVEEVAFPFLNSTSPTLLLAEWKGRGIVMAVSSAYYLSAVHALRIIREVHQCDLPIELFCIDRSELSETQLMYLLSFPDVNVKYAEDYVNQEYADIKSWAIKPFAMLFSKFQEVMLIDADVIVFRSPLQIFSDHQYLKTKALFYKDRILIGTLPARKSFLNDILPIVRDEVKSTPMYKGYSYHRQEAGLLVIDKSDHLHAVLFSCKLNCKEERKKLWSETHGEKEAYWLAMEMVGDYLYSFNSSPVGVIGERRAQKVCGHMLHVNSEKQPTWMNGSVRKDKDNTQSELIAMDHWALEDSIVNKWDTFLYCYGDVTVMNFTDTERIFIDQIQSLWSNVLEVTPL